MSKIGLDCRIYRNTGTYGSPVWNEVTNVRDATLNLEKGEADVSSRGTGEYRARKGTLKDATVDFTMMAVAGDADFETIRDAFFDDAAIEFLVLDGDISDSGSQGLRATMEVFGFTRGENLEDAVSYDVAIKPTYATNPPEWYEVP